MGKHLLASRPNGVLVILVMLMFTAFAIIALVYQASVASLQEQRDTVTASLQATQESLSNVQLELDRLKIQFEVAQQDVSTFDELYAVATDELETTSRELLDTNQQLILAQQTIGNQTQIITTITSQLTQLSDQVDILINQTQTMNTTIRTLRDDIKIICDGSLNMTGSAQTRCDRYD